MHSLPPGAILMLGAPLLPFLLEGAAARLPAPADPELRAPAPSASAARDSSLELFGQTLVPIRIDRLALVWGHVFHIAAMLGALYALRVDDRVQQTAAPIYAGSAIAAAFAGDLLTLFVYWELTAVSSVFLVWAGRSLFGERSLRAGMRYLIIQVTSGVLLLAGAVMHVADSGSLAFDHLGLVSPGTTLIFLAFGMKACFPLLHNWLQDAYPESTPSGTVFLSAFSTKLAIYALARGFAGTECLIWIGAIMTAFPIFFAVIENDLRRVLAYSLNNQLGFMVVGIGVGTELALNGTAAHAFAHILYKGLLFMSMGAVLMRTGTIKASELGGLHKSMPWTTVFCIVGALSISAMPLFSGFTTKSMIITAVGDHHLLWVFLVLVFASAGVVDHSGIKVPFFTFFAHDSGRRVKEAPLEMLIAMGITAALCVAIGIFPAPLYRILPYDIEYHAYTGGHVVGQLQLLFFAAMAFAILFRSGLYPPEVRSRNLDSDWLYRKLAPAMLRPVVAGCGAIDGAWRSARAAVATRGGALIARVCGPRGFLGGAWTTGGAVVWISVVLLGFLLAYYRH
ncbi:MAG: Na(+)/H(+) antiporter subunit D [Planctomycetota bacterium]